MANLLPTLLIMIVMACIAALSVWIQEPLFAPSLASAVFVQLLSPTEPDASPYHALVGQLTGIVAGFIGVFVASAAATPPFFGSHPLVFERVIAVAIAVAVTAFGQLLLKATSPAGGATAVILAIGLESANLAGAARMAAGIVLVTGLGELARQLLLRRRPVHPK